MKRLFLFLFFISFSVSLLSQVVDPVSWDYSVKKTGANTAELIFEADIEGNWHLYAQNFKEGGPVRTNFQFDDSENFELVGETSESPDPKEEYDELFEMDVKYFSNQATFTQKIKFLSDKTFNITGNIEYQVCQEDKCVYFNPDFEFQVKGDTEKVTSESEKAETEETEETEDSSVSETGDSLAGETDDVSVSETEDKAKKDNNRTTGEKSLVGLFFMALGLGLVGILTPCVYPMIPMTVTFFMQGQSNRIAGLVKALIFGLSIVFLYTLVGVIVSLTSAGADFTSLISTHWIPNLIFFLLFLTFAASFFGLFEIVLPSGIANKADKQVDKGGFLASFFMALTLVIVSFSCTGPIVGGLLVKAASGGVVEPTIGMLGFGLGFGLPFTLLAIFPGWLKNMPKSGGWMNAVKVVLAFIILAFSFYFLSKIEANYHLNILSRDVFLAIWISIFMTLGLYLLGKIRFANDSELTKVPVFRMLLAIASFTFAIYLVPGLFGANLSPLSSVLPPQSEQNFTITSQQAPASETPSETMCGDAKYSDFLHLPYNIKGYFDYEQGMECAKELNKPALVYFTGHSCSNCKQMQAKVWSDSEVQKILKEDYVVIALYIDDKEKLPESEWIKSEYDGKTKKTIGKFNADLQITRFNSNTQPYYVLLDNSEEELTEPMGYELDTKEFIDFLDRGMKNFNR
ncbi:MAG: cytochrome c biogenesis protein CcdA [Bacteroidota bacterium]